MVVTDNLSGDDSVAQLNDAVARHGWASWCEIRPLPRNGERGSPGTVLRFVVMPARSRTASASLPVSSASNGRRSSSARWLSVPPDTRRKPSPASASASAAALATTPWA